MNGVRDHELIRVPFKKLFILLFQVRLGRSRGSGLERDSNSLSINRRCMDLDHVVSLSLFRVRDRGDRSLLGRRFDLRGRRKDMVSRAGSQSDHLVQFSNLRPYLDVLMSLRI
jgi:hypothetical protein